MPSIRHALPFVGLLACTPSEPIPTAASEPVFVEEMPADPSRSLGPLLGGTVVVRSPQLGRWAASIDFDQHRFITMEHTVSNRITGSVVLRLEAGGRASACALASEASASAVSHFQANDGKDHHDASEHTVLVGMTGSWRGVASGPELEVVFDRMNWQGCEVDPNQEAFAQPPLRCVGFAANAKVPRDALLCEVPEALHPLVMLSLQIGDSPRAGSWTQRFDPSGHGEPPPAAGPAGPWLLLGIDPGLALRSRDHDRDAEPLTIVESDVRDPVAGNTHPR
jgi:hypothetical protein